MQEEIYVLWINGPTTLVISWVGCNAIIVRGTPALQIAVIQTNIFWKKKEDLSMQLKKRSGWACGLFKQTTYYHSGCTRAPSF